MLELSDGLVGSIDLGAADDAGFRLGYPSSLLMHWDLYFMSFRFDLCIGFKRPFCSLSPRERTSFSLFFYSALEFNGFFLHCCLTCYGTNLLLVRGSYHTPLQDLIPAAQKLGTALFDHVFSVHRETLELENALHDLIDLVDV